MKKLITLSFIPSLQNVGILTLRLWFGVGLLWIHGLDKVIHMGTTMDQFKSVGFSSFLAVCAILAENVGSFLVVIGLATRWAALAVATTMFVAFSQVHHFDLNPMNQPNGELAFLYLGVFVSFILTGAGRFSVDAILSRPEPVYATTTT